VVENDYL